MRICSRITGHLLAAALLALAVATAPASRAAEAAPNRDATSILNGMRLKRMTQDLKLTDDQQKKVKTILDEEGKQVRQIQEDGNLSLSEKYDKQAAIKADSRKKMNEVFTDEQRKKWDEQSAKQTKKPKTAKPAPDKSAN